MMGRKPGQSKSNDRAGTELSTLATSSLLLGMPEKLKFHRSPTKVLSKALYTTQVFIKMLLSPAMQAERKL
jgi:hypothetical protein